MNSDTHYDDKGLTVLLRVLETDPLDSRSLIISYGDIKLLLFTERSGGSKLGLVEEGTQSSITIKIILP